MMMMMMQHAAGHTTPLDTCSHLFVTSEKPPTTPAPGSGSCIPLFEPYGHHCYLVYNAKQGFSWPDARHYCQLFHGELASVHSRAEVEFIRKLNHTWYHDLWIGLTRDNNCKAAKKNKKEEEEEAAGFACVLFL